MKNLKIISHLFILLSFTISCKDKDSCKCFDNRCYIYPQYICTEADSSDCYSKKLKAMMLPAEFLYCSSTDTLALTCRRYPYMLTIWLYIPMQEGFDYLRKSFNGFDELYARKDVSSVMINYYGLTNILGLNDIIDPIERGRFMINILYWEIIIAQFEFIDSLKTEDIKSLLDLVISKYYQKASIESYGLVGKASTLAIAARILYSQGYEPFLEKISSSTGLSQFINNADFSGTSDPENIIQIVITDSQDYLKTLI
jgi:hypothetical protein